MKLLTLIAVAMTVAAPLSAATIHVDLTATGANNGSNWANAYTDLQDALAIAVSGDEIWVAAGTYKPTLGTDQSATFTLSSGIAVYGGFDGSETSLGERDYESNLTALSGEIGAPGASDNSDRVVAIEGIGNNAVLDGFTISDGNSETFGGLAGGGVYLYRTNATLRNLTITGNQAELGGGVYNFAGTPTFENVTFSNNIATDGAALYNHNLSTTTLNSVRFFDNSGWNDLYNYRGEIVFDDVQFVNVSTGTTGFYNVEANNLAMTSVTFSNYTQAIRLFDCSPTIGSTLFSSITNEAIYFSSAGGTVLNCQFFSSGRGIYTLHNATVVTVESCLFDGETGTRAAVLTGGTNTFVNCVFLNHRWSGFDPYVVTTSSPFSASFVNCTFANALSLPINEVISIRNTNPQPARVYNSILWNPSAGGDELDGIVEVSNSLVRNSGGSSSWSLPQIDVGGNVDSDPKFVDISGDNFDLMVGSPAVDGGDNSAPLIAITDYHGNNRIFGVAVDMGAVELMYPTAVTSTLRPRLGDPFPNPFNPTVTIPFEDLNNGTRIDVFDAAGHWVAQLHVVADTPRGALTWSGINSFGQPVASGVYFVRAMRGQWQASKKIVLMK